MIDHNLTHLGLNENYEGEQIQPSERGNLRVPSTLRQFIIQANRAYSPSALEAAQDFDGLKLTYHTNNTLGNFMDDEEEVGSYFAVKFIIQPEDFAEFVAHNGDAFYDRVLELLSKSTARGVRGNRGAFLGEFNRENHADYGMVLVTQALISTTVFYNDYRATVGFPGTNAEVKDVVGSIYQTLVQEYPELKLEMSYDIIETCDC